jgi:hypothetical protein
MIYRFTDLQIWLSPLRLSQLIIHIRYTRCFIRYTLTGYGLQGFTPTGIYPASHSLNSFARALLT